MKIQAGASTTARLLAAVICAVALAQTDGAGAATARAASCAAAEPGHPRPLLDRVPVLMSAHMTVMRDGGVVIAFSSYRGTRDFPGRDFTVLGLDRSGCLRWRASLPGSSALARPVQAGDGSIVVASQALSGYSEGLRLYTLAASTGRVLQRDLFASLASTTGAAPTLVSDRRGDVAAVLSTRGASQSPRRASPVTLTLTRRAHATRWSRQVIARSNTQPPAAMARRDGTMVVGYPRGGRFLVRTGTVAGRLGAPADAGPVTSNFRGAGIALGQDGTIATLWQSATHSSPWRLRAAVRPATGRAFAPFAELGFDSGRGGFFGGAAPAVRVGASGRVTVAFTAPSTTTPRGERTMCATATPAGRFGPARQIALGAPPNLPDQAAMIFGPAASAEVVTTMPNADTLTTSLVTVDAGCFPRAPRPLDPAAGIPEQAVIDSQGRAWVLGQDRAGASISGRRALLLTISAPTAR
jgi:hypothetical protein